MYAFFRGIVDQLTESEVWLDVNGVGYEIQISPSTAGRLSGLAEGEVTIYTYTMVREDQLGLYGFLTRDELALFKQLITVSGVGPKAGLSLLSALDADDLRFAIISGDVKTISRAPGIGKRTAERLVLELKDKIEMPGLGGGDAPSIGDVSAPDLASEQSDAVEALTALGYARTDAVRAVKKAAESGADGTEALLKSALKFMM